MRWRICDGLGLLRIALDLERNRSRAREIVISKPDAAVGGHRHGRADKRGDDRGARDSGDPRRELCDNTPEGR
jgi:hypothetical protein